MHIIYIRADYELEAARGLKIGFKINNNEKNGQERGYSFDPDSDDYRLMTRLTVKDEIISDEWEYEKWIDLRPSLEYGFLDELIENTLFKWAKGMAGDPDGMIGGYRVDHPAVAWMCRKETFDKVVRGQSIFDIRTFQGEIIGDNKDGNQIRILLFNNRKAQVFLNGDLKIHTDLKELKNMTFDETNNALENMTWKND